MLLVTVIAATLLFYLFLHQVSSFWLDVAARPDVRDALQRSLDDQKRLRALDPAHRDEYRDRFEATRKLLARIDVIRMNREAILRRFELALVAVFATTLAAAAIVSSMRSRRAEVAKRREYLDRLATWQQAARRHAHELRTPLTAARLEVERLGDVTLRDGATISVEPILEELDRLARYTREYASFGAVGEPVLRLEPLAHVLDEFISTFGNAWPGLALRLEQRGDAHVCADRDMLRQVLVNLCTNSARAGAGSIAFLIGRERARITLDVRDDGGGIPDSLLPRIFDPYVTTTRPGEGMGLGLAISRKIMLDHGGDLALAATSPLGTTFRLTFGNAACN